MHTVPSGPTSPESALAVIGHLLRIGSKDSALAAAEKFFGSGHVLVHAVKSRIAIPEGRFVNAPRRLVADFRRIHARRVFELSQLGTRRPMPRLSPPNRPLSVP